MIRKPFRIAAVIAAIFAVGQTTGFSLVTSTGNPEHTSERALQRALRSLMKTPTAFPFFENVGILNESTGVYIGRGYVLTAAHVGPGEFQLADGSTYQPIPGSEQRFQNPDGSFSDLCVFRIRFASNDSLAKLKDIPLGPVCPNHGSYVVMMGAGSGNSGTNRRSSAGAKFHWNDDYRIRWGVNRVANQFGSMMKTFRYQTPGYSTEFRPGSFQCQATPGDSGGAAFVYNRHTKQWELGGIILAVDSEDGGAAFGNQTYIADLTILPSDVFKSAGLVATRSR
tara:strand:+ start:8065 stop:8910 length:846 start_codon:yes stop_codon:yes gene_type:complete